MSLLADSSLPEAAAQRAPTPSAELLQSLRRLAGPKDFSRPRSAHEARRLPLTARGPCRGAGGVGQPGEGLSISLGAGQGQSIGSRPACASARGQRLHHTQPQPTRNEANFTQNPEDLTDQEARRRFQDPLGRVEAALASAQGGAGPERHRDEREAGRGAGAGLLGQQGGAEASATPRGLLRHWPRRGRPEEDSLDEEPSVPGAHGSTRERIAEKIEALRKDPVARREFEDHLKVMREKKRPTSGKNFGAINQGRVRNYAQEARAEILQRSAAKRAEARSLASRRREEAEQAAEERACWWAGKTEAHKLAREEEARRTEEGNEVLRRCSLWLRHLLMVGFAVRLCSQSKEQKMIKAEVRRQVAACITIQGWFLRQLGRRRRKAVYRNMVKLKIAVASYVRVMQAASLSVAQPRVQWFLKMNLSDNRDVSFSSVVVNFLKHIRRVQRCFRRMVMQRKARTDALLDHFLAARILSSAPSFLASASAAPTPVGGASLPPATPNSASASTPSGKKRGSVLERSTSRSLSQTARRATLRPGAKQGGRPTALAVSFAGGNGADAAASNANCLYGTVDGSWAFVKDWCGQELLPNFIRVHAVRQHVVKMHQNYHERLGKWKAQRASMQVDDEIEHMGLGWHSNNLDAVRQRPRPIELTRVGALYSETYDEYLRGDFKSVVHSRKQLLGKAWRAWWRLAGNLEEELDHLELMGSVTTVESLGAAAASVQLSTAGETPRSRGSRRQQASAGAQGAAQLHILRHQRTGLSERSDGLSRGFSRGFKRSTLSSLGTVAALEL